MYCESLGTLDDILVDAHSLHEGHVIVIDRYITNIEILVIIVVVFNRYKKCLKKLKQNFLIVLPQFEIKVSEYSSRKLIN